jgi:hypothetical protein
LWQALLRHIKRRNEFVHRGQLPTVEDARESLQTCARFHDRLINMAAEAARRIGIEAVARRRMLELAKTWLAEAKKSDDTSPKRSDETQT